MNELSAIVLSTFIVSLGSLVGIVTVAVNTEKLNKILLFLVSLSTGAMLGGAFFHLLPEASEMLKGDMLYGIVLFAFVLFFFIEKLFHWRHCHKGECDVHTFGVMNLVGDSIHNFVDGLILAAAYLTDFRLGLVTTLAIGFHEIPQEIGDFGVLLYAGYTKKKAMILNFLVALTAVLGGIVGFFASESVSGFTPYLLPFAAGGFIYVAASDMMPEIRKEKSLKKSLISFGIVIAGIILMLMLRLVGGE